ncbi:hypothetical protein ES703_51656 [subsurface metagenome]
MAKCYISMRDVQAYQFELGVKLIVVTDIPCHLYMRWSFKPPWSHASVARRRGLAMHTDRYYCFTTYHDNEQEEAGDTLTHTFIKTPWPYCECRYFYFWGKVGDTVCISDTPCFQLHMNCAKAPPVMEVESNDCQTEHDQPGLACQQWNACSQTFTPDHDYEATMLSLLLTQYDINRKGPLIVKLELPAVNCWEAEVIWSKELYSRDLPYPGDYRWTRFYLGDLPLTKDTVYRITVHTLPGWYYWSGTEWELNEAQAAIRWLYQADTNPYPRGFLFVGCNFKVGEGSWSVIADNDFAFCVSEPSAPPDPDIDKEVEASTDDCYTYSTAIQLALDDLFLDYADYDMHLYARFLNIQLLKGTTIDKAYIDLKAFGNYVGSSSLRILGIKQVDTATFSTQGDADGRPVTDAFVDWTPGNWTAGEWYGRTNDPQDITAIIQEIVNQAGWLPGNALAIKIINTARGLLRYADTFEEGHPARLHIEYTTPE